MELKNLNKDLYVLPTLFDNPIKDRKYKQYNKKYKLYVKIEIKNHEV